MNRTYLPFTLEQLIILRAIVTDGSFKKAAQRLHMTQSAVRLQIQSLEKQLKITLFGRTKKQIQLTQAGNLLLQYANRILSLCDETVDDLNDFKSGKLILDKVASKSNNPPVTIHKLGLFKKNFNISFTINLKK